MTDIQEYVCIPRGHVFSESPFDGELLRCPECDATLIRKKLPTDGRSIAELSKELWNAIELLAKLELKVTSLEGEVRVLKTKGLSEEFVAPPAWEEPQAEPAPAAPPEEPKQIIYHYRLTTVCKLKKYKDQGKTFEELCTIDPMYVLWCVQNLDNAIFDPEVEALAKKHLDGE